MGWPEGQHLVAFLHDVIHVLHGGDGTELRAFGLTQCQARPTGENLAASIYEALQLPGETSILSECEATLRSSATARPELSDRPEYPN